MRDGYNAPPFNPLPAVVWITILPIVAMEIVLSAGELGVAGGAAGVGWRTDALSRFALSPEMLGAMVEAHRWPLDFLMRFVSYIFVSQAFVQALMVTVLTLALGKVVAEVYRPWAYFTVFLLSGIAGGIAYSLLPGQKVWLVGGYPAVYGLIGAFTYIIRARLALTHVNRERAFLLIGLLVGYQILIWAMFGGALTWIADIAGFAAGYGLSFLVAPGAFDLLMRRIRRR